MIITQTPLRIGLAGGGTDIPSFYEADGGFVINAAIDKYIFVVVKERFDDKICVGYTKREFVDHLEEVQHELVREALRMTQVTAGVEISILGDIPAEGSGLGSSSAVTVGVLNALYAYRGEQVTAEQLAQQACEIEIQRCQKPIGKQDQYIAAFGGLRALTFQKNGDVATEKMNISEENWMSLDQNLMLFYSDQTRKAANILKNVSAAMDKNRTHLDQIKLLAATVRQAIAKGNLDELGRALDKNWHLKKALDPYVSNSVLDEMMTLAKKAGALGGKFAGAGGGGFLLLYCPRAKQEEVRQALKGYREMPFHLEQDGSKIIFNYRRYRWKK